MNILYYQPNSIKLPEAEDSEGNSDNSSEEDHFIGIGLESNRKGHMIDVYVSWVQDIQSKMIVNVN